MQLLINQSASRCAIFRTSIEGPSVVAPGVASRQPEVGSWQWQVSHRQHGSGARGSLSGAPPGRRPPLGWDRGLGVPPGPPQAAGRCWIVPAASLVGVLPGPLQRRGPLLVVRSSLRSAGRAEAGDPLGPINIGLGLRGRIGWSKRHGRVPGRMAGTAGPHATCEHREVHPANQGSMAGFLLRFVLFLVSSTTAVV